MIDTWPPPSLSTFAEQMPFEHLLRKRPVSEALARWRSERQAHNQATCKCNVGLLMAAAGDRALALQTLASWQLQTWHQTSLVLVGDQSRAWKDDIDSRATGLHVLAIDDSNEIAGLGIDWIVPAVAGDILHPSLAGVVACQASHGSAAVAWDWLGACRAGTSVQLERRHRGPFRDDLAELTRDLRGHAFALPSQAWRGHSVNDPWTTRMQVPSQDARWHVHPEPLGIYFDHDQAISPPTPAFAAKLWGVPFVHMDMQLAPARTPFAVSVVIHYRDRADLTLRAIKSVLAQRLSSPLELVLVDNQSTQATKAQIAEFILQLPQDVRTLVVPYDLPFNHSRQSNLAAAEARGEVLLFLNNDAELLDPICLDVLSRWALVPGVASAGVRVVDDQGATTGGGMRARRLPGAEFNSPVEEATGFAAEIPRVTVGNTFACAAVSADVFRRLGGMNEVHFPNGYNDVDYCLRASQQGWRHVNLAQVRISHAVGASRARTDEIAQKLSLRTGHTWLASRALQEIDLERVVLPAVELPSYSNDALRAPLGGVA